MTKHRVVSVGDRKAWNRLSRIVQQAIIEAVEQEDRDFRRQFVERGLEGRIIVAVANAARAEGLVLTWQTKA